MVLALCVVTIAFSAEAAPKKKKKRPKTPTVEKTEVTAEFDRQAAASAIVEANLDKCKTPNAARGEGHVTITFTPKGSAQNAVVDRGPWLGTPVAKCMQKEFKKVKVPPFKGDPITVGKLFNFE